MSEMNDIGTLTKMAKENSESISVLTKSLAGLTDKLSKTPDYAQAGMAPWQIPGYDPSIRKGEDPMTSRGFSFIKMIGLLSGGVKREQAKVELDVHNYLDDQYCKELGESNGYNYGGGGVPGLNKFLAPLAPSFMQDSIINRQKQHEFKSLVAAGAGNDIDEMRWINQQRYKSMGYDAKSLSWLDELRGGALVAPAEQGELIALLRNKEALVNAGARTVPLPPQGRLKYPRQTAASTTYWVGENAGITESQIGTGEVTLQAKKLAVLIKAPNELIRFASPAAEALMRDDMTKSLALGLDLAGLEGQGGDTRPLGIINQPFINTVTSSNPGPNGDAFVPNDIYRLIASIEEANAEFEAFIMRPKSLYKWYQLRADAVAQGDQQGLFMFNLIREAGADSPATLGGYPVVKSTQVSQVQSKGSSSNLTYIVGGMWSDLLIGMFGAIEFATTTMGDTPFQNDQTWVRGILSADIQPRHQSAFCYMPTLKVNTGS